MIHKNMKTEFKVPKEIITSIDVVNTLQGGTSEPRVNVEQFSTHRQITLRVPGLSPDNIKIEINDNQLVIYYYTSILSQKKDLQIPRVLYNKGIPYFVDAKSISAKRLENALVVELPFNELAGGFHRDIMVDE